MSESRSTNLPATVGSATRASSTRCSSTFARRWSGCNSARCRSIVQDGVVVQVERIERKRFRRGER